MHTYVFKGGVDYRGELTVREAGKPDDPSGRGLPVRLRLSPGAGRVG